MEIPPALVPAAVRSLHVLSGVVLVGGLAFARFAALESVLDRALARYRALAGAAMLVLLATGIYNIAVAGGRSTLYHALFGIKVLLALHVFAAASLAARPGVELKARLRRLTGVVISGSVVVVLGVVLRYV